MSSMLLGAATDAVDAILVALQKGLGDRLMALYLYGSLAEGTYQSDQSDVNLLAVIECTTDLHLVRSALQPIWDKHASALVNIPIVATQPELERHLALDPIFAGHLVQAGKLLHGDEQVIKPPKYRSQLKYWLDMLGWPCAHHLYWLLRCYRKKRLKKRR